MQLYKSHFYCVKKKKKKKMKNILSSISKPLRSFGLWMDSLGSSMSGNTETCKGFFFFIYKNIHFFFSLLLLHELNSM